MAALKEKPVKKMRIQYGKLITDARFWKPPKRKTTFRSAASAVRDSGVDLHRSFVTER